MVEMCAPIKVDMVPGKGLAIYKLFITLSTASWPWSLAGCHISVAHQQQTHDSLSDSKVSLLACVDEPHAYDWQTCMLGLFVVCWHSMVQLIVNHAILSGWKLSPPANSLNGNVGIQTICVILRVC